MGYDFIVVVTPRLEIVMPRTEITWATYWHDGLRNASDMTDEEWSLIVPLLPRRNRIGRARQTDLRALANAIYDMAAIGCQWQRLSK